MERMPLVMLARMCIFCIYLVLFGAQARAQEELNFVDNTAQEMYGPDTTHYVTIADLKYNVCKRRPFTIDIARLDHFTYRQRTGYQWQDLGNAGTATRPIFYGLPKHIGATSGFCVYDVYFQDMQQLRYYDAQSPYTHAYVVLANYGSYVFDGWHSRSFNSHWHLGARFQTLLTDKEFIPTKVPADRQVISYPFTLFLHYKSPDARYQLLTSLYRKQHRVRETGGITAGGSSRVSADWLKAKAPIRNNLTPRDEVETGELRYQYHLYHQWAWKDPVQFYHELSLQRRTHHFAARCLSASSQQLLGKPLHSIQLIRDNTLMQTLGNEVGLKGDISRIFYRCYYAHRRIDLTLPQTTRAQKFHEHYMGLEGKVPITERLGHLHVHGTYLWDRFYQFQAGYQSKFLEVSYEQLKAKPSCLVMQYSGNHHAWHNRHFTPSVAKQLSGSVLLNTPMVYLKPTVALIRVEKPIYFNKLTAAAGGYNTVAPHQSDTYADIMTLATTANLTVWRDFHADNQVILAKTQGPAAAVFSMPTALVYTRLYYATQAYAGKLDVETGLDVHWHTPYAAPGYDPAIQQFYQQTNYVIAVYPVVNLFFNFRIKHFCGFIKVIHLNQELPWAGYFVTPTYPAQSRSLDVGVSWSFFD